MQDRTSMSPVGLYQLETGQNPCKADHHCGEWDMWDVTPWGSEVWEVSDIKSSLDCLGVFISPVLTSLNSVHFLHTFGIRVCKVTSNRTFLSLSPLTNLVGFGTITSVQKPILSGYLRLLFSGDTGYVLYSVTKPGGSLAQVLFSRALSCYILYKLYF